MGNLVTTAMSDELWWEREKLYRLKDIAKSGRLPIPVKRRTLQEYVKVGSFCKHSREKILLESIRVGGVYYTSLERVREFVRELNEC